MKKILFLIAFVCVFQMSYSQDDFQSYGSKAPSIQQAGFIPWCYHDPLVYILGINNGGFALKRAGVIFCNNCPDDPLTIPSNPQYLYDWDTNLISETYFVQTATSVSFSDEDVFRQRWFIETTSGDVYYGNISENTVNCEDPGSQNTPTVTTSPIIQLDLTTASCGGNVIDDGGSSVTARGVCWNTTSSPTLADSYTNDSTGEGTFTSTLTGLSAGNTYYVRAYATNTSGTSYGEDKDILIASKPEIWTGLVTAISTTTATGGGSVTSSNGAMVTARGVCWNTSGTLDELGSNYTVDGSGTGVFTSSLTGLSPGTLYYVQAYATNLAGTNFGTQTSFTTTSVGTLATVHTRIVNSVTATTAYSGGDVTADGYSTVTARGVCWDTATMPTTADSHTTDGTGTGIYSSAITGLTHSTPYYVRSYATNTSGTAYGEEKTFTTACQRPTGLNTYYLAYGIEKDGPFINFTSSSETAKQACFDWNTPGDRALTVIESQTVSLGVGNMVYAGGGTSCLLVQDGYYLGLGEGTQRSKLIRIVNGEVTINTNAIVPGDEFGGGIIAYILGSSDPGYSTESVNGLIISNSDISTEAVWGCSGTDILTSNLLNQGQTNTGLILSGCGTSGIAAELCDDYSNSGFTDWFLPSLYELEFSVGNVSSLPENIYYWSSSQSSPTAAGAAKRVGSSYGVTSNFKSTSYRVRAIRYF
jgi:hypothetical protein